MTALEPTHVSEYTVNASKGYGIGGYDQPIDETIFADDHSPGALYRFGVSEYGRCIGKVYVDTSDVPAHVGYVFQSRREYQDCHETYLHETWLTLVHKIPAESICVPLESTR